MADKKLSTPGRGAKTGVKPAVKTGATKGADSSTSTGTEASRADEVPEDRIHEPRRWRDNGWTAQVIKNEDDEGWAVAMTPDGQSEPALVGPWTMGRDKKNPKPLDTNAFNTLVKTASEVIRRHEQQLQATLHKAVAFRTDDGTSWRVTLDVVPDEMDAHALLSAWDAEGERVAQVKVAAGFKLSAASAERWVLGGFVRPG